MEARCTSADEMETLILSAVHEDNIHRLEAYLSTVTNPNLYINRTYDQSHGQKCTILVIACLNGYERMIQMLLNYFKPDLEILNIVRMKDNDQELETFVDVTALWVAAALNKLEMLQLFVENGAQVNHRTSTHSTPLRCACCNGNIDMVRYLVQNGADVRLTKIKHFTNLVASVFNGHIPMVAYLIDELGCDVNECLDDGRSPLTAGVYLGSLKMIQFLLDRGARNTAAHYNNMSPLMLAAEKRRIDLVNAISEQCSIVEQIEAEELLGSAFICRELGYSDSQQAVEHWSRAMEHRSIHQLPKVLNELTYEALGHRQECSTIDELRKIQSNSNDLYIEALLIRERLLGPNNVKYLHSLHYRCGLLAEYEQFHSSLMLNMYRFSLHRRYSVDIDKEDLRELPSLFGYMIFASLPVRIESLYTGMTIVVEELERNTLDFDYHLCTLLFLITIASQILMKTYISTSDRQMICRFLYTINQRRYATRMAGFSLLHLSLNERTRSDEFSFDQKYRYPCVDTVRLLLQCRADVNANSIERLTPLHVFAAECTGFYEAILQLLLDAGAHPDYVNESGHTAHDITLNSNMEQLLQTKMAISLKCLCARQVQRAKIPFQGKISSSLATFIERH